MATIKDLINAIDANDMSLQFMTHGNCTLKIRGKGEYMEAKFESAPQNMHKEAVVIWVDHSKLKDAIESVKN